METSSNNLSTLRILFIVKGIFNLIGALFCAGYGFFISLFITQFNEADADADFITTFIGIFSGIGFILLLAVAILTFLTAKYLGETRNHTFITVVSVLNCLTGILGILLGVFTLIEINKPHVKPLFMSKV